jgi:putative oxidoreductase
MKYQKIIYWTTTVFFSLWMIKNSYAYLTSEQAKQLCVHFGLPDYLRIELAICKIIGVFILILYPIKDRLKEWAYAGFTITMISGFIAHLSSGDSLTSAI